MGFPLEVNKSLNTTASSFAIRMARERGREDVGGRYEGVFFGLVAIHSHSG